MSRLPHIALVLFVLAFAAAPAVAQVPRIDDAELIFSQGVEAFEEGDYGMAYRRFRYVYQTFDLNRKTSAAYLMAGKALYRDGQYDDAAELLEAFVETYPSSGYVGEARRVRDFALEAASGDSGVAETIDLGIILPMEDGNTDLTQALFNGVRLAVDEFNGRAGEGPLVRMIFRDTRGTQAAAAAAVRELARSEGADVIIGPLYSEEARAAAAAAEREGVVLVAPMATDDDVARGRSVVFQANPTIATRGRLMARFAMRSLRLDDFGVVAEQGTASISERMAEAFQEEVVLSDGTVVFYELLAGPRGWSRLPEALGADTLRRARAVYLPVTGPRSEALIEAALIGLSRMGVNVRVLGNAEWHDLPFRRLADRYGATYTNDFFVDPAQAEVQDFQRRYRALAGAAPEAGTINGRLAYTGYDLGRFLLQQMAARPGAPLAAVLEEAPLYQGLGIRIDFEDNVNEALYYHRYRNGELELVR